MESSEAAASVIALRREHRRRAPDGVRADPGTTARDPGELYRELAPAVLGYLRSQRVPDPEDVLGEVFYQVARDIRRFRGGGRALRSWVFSIAHNRLIDDRRRRGVRPEELTAEPPVGAVAPPADEQLTDPELVAALSMLTPDQREVLGLRFVADLPLRQVARITNRRVGAVKALQARALAGLERHLGGPG